MRIVGTTLSRATVAIAAAILVLAAAIPAAASANAQGKVRTTSDTWYKVQLSLDMTKCRSSFSECSSVKTDLAGTSPSLVDPASADKWMCRGGIGATTPARDIEAAGFFCTGPNDAALTITGIVRDRDDYRTFFAFDVNRPSGSIYATHLPLNDGKPSDMNTGTSRTVPIGSEDAPLALSSYVYRVGLDIAHAEFHLRGFVRTTPTGR